MKMKGLNLFLSVILVLSLAACGSTNTSKDLPSAQFNDSTLSTAGSNSNQNAIVDNESTQSESESAQADVSESNEVNNSAQNTSNSQDLKGQVTQNQNDTTAADNNAVVSVKVAEISNEVIANTSIVDITSNASQNNSVNNYKLINLNDQTFHSETEFIQYLKSNGATYVSSTQEALTIINNTCKSANPGLNLCFSGNVDIDALIKAFPQDSTLSKYIDMNIRQIEFNCIQLGSSKSYYFGAKFTWWTTPSEEAAVNDLVAQVLPSLNHGTTYDKIKNVHDYICNISNYSTATLTGAADDFSAYDALFKKLAVCQGYALAFQKFMDAMGIEGQIVKGNIDTVVASGSHAWNVVKLNGAWYSVDCTWDGQDDITRYDYFLLGAKEYPYGITGGISLAVSRYNIN